MISPYWNARLTRDLTNLSLVRHRNSDGHIISMHQSGTHWLRNMLSLAMARAYNLPEPEYIQDNDFICAPQDASKYPKIPRIVSSHQIPTPLITNRLALSLIRLPDYVLLMRDPRVIAASHYRRFEARYKIPFSEYLRANVELLRQNSKKRKFDKDIWWDLRFQNSWERMMQLRPGHIHLVRYEELRRDTARHLRAIMQFLHMPAIDDETLAWCIEQSSKESMAQKESPDIAHKVVQQDNKNPLAIYSDDDKRFFVETYRKYCKADFGYDFEAGW